MVDYRDINDDFLRMVSDGYLVGVKEFIKKGYSDVNYVNEDGDTALTIATSRNDMKIVHELLKAGADVECGQGSDLLLSLAEYHNNELLLDLILDTIDKNKKMRTTK